MITTEAASVAISITKGIIKLSGEVDMILAEKAAVHGPLALTVPNLSLGLNMSVMRAGLEELLIVDAESLTAAEAANIRSKIKINSGSKQELHDLVRRYLPKLAGSRYLDLTSDFIKELKKSRPEWANDPQLQVAAFYVAQGDDDRKTSYTWRIALTVVDVLAEFGTENIALFTRDPKVQGIVSSVLKRFGDADLQKLDSSKAVLRAVLSATLNGALDNRALLESKNPWVDGLLDALVATRASLPAATQDEFLVGLVQGKGYPALVANLLEAAAGQINNDDVTDFKDVTSDFLKKVAGIVKTKDDFEDFFNDHWGDLVRAALSSVSVHGPALLGDQKLIGKILSQVAGDLAKHENNKLLSADSLFGIVNSTAAAVAADSALAGQLFGPSKVWLEKLIGTVATTISDKGIRKVFSQEGIEALFKDAFATFAKNPELLAGDSELAGALIGGVLSELSQTKSFALRELATVSVSGALTAISQNPSLLDTKYPELVASFAGNVSKLVEEKKLSGIQGSQLIEAALKSMAENPELFLELERKLGEEVLNAVVSVAGIRPGHLVAGASLIQITREVLSALSRNGKASLENQTSVEMVASLEKLLDAGLARAEKEIGHTLALPSLPPVLGLLVESWAKGNISHIDPENDNFKKLFVELTTQAAA